MPFELLNISSGVVYSVCYPCRETPEDAELREYLREQSKNTFEERLRNIEKYLYKLENKTSETL